MRYQLNQELYSDKAKSSFSNSESSFRKSDTEFVSCVENLTSGRKSSVSISASKIIITFE